MVKVKRKWAKRIAAVFLACALGAGAVGALVGNERCLDFQCR